MIIKQQGGKAVGPCASWPSIAPVLCCAFQCRKLGFLALQTLLACRVIFSWFGSELGSLRGFGQFNSEDLMVGFATPLFASIWRLLQGAARAIFPGWRRPPGAQAIRTSTPNAAVTGGPPQALGALGQHRSRHGVIRRCQAAVGCCRNALFSLNPVSPD